jgi:hypothetical protein
MITLQISFQLPIITSDIQSNQEMIIIIIMFYYVLSIIAKYLLTS